MPLPSLPTFDYGSWLKSESRLRLQIYKCTPDNLDNEAQVELELILVGIFEALKFVVFVWSLIGNNSILFKERKKREKNWKQEKN